MSKSIREFYEEISGSRELQEKLKELAKKKDQNETIKWLKENGCDASFEEIREFLNKKKEKNPEEVELSPEELEQAVGGIDASMLDEWIEDDNGNVSSCGNMNTEPEPCGHP